MSGIAEPRPRNSAPEAEAFLQAKATSDTSEVTAQALERLRLDSASAQRLSGQLAESLSALRA